MNRLIENRAVSSEATKPMIEGRNLSGHWLVFNELSEPMIGKVGERTVVFREKINSRALDNCDFSNTKCCLNHDENNKFLGRVPKTLTIEKDDRGGTYNCILPDVATGNEVIEFANRGDYTGNSFRFVTMSGDDVWERQADGSFIREVMNIRAVLHVGPVLDPAYPQTDLNVAMRSLETSGLMIEVEEEIIPVNFKSARSRRIDILEKY